MTGPAIRYWEFARVLNQYFAVTLAIPPSVQEGSTPEALDPPFQVRVCQRQSELKALVNDADVVITVGANLSIFPFLTKINKPLVVDMYIPFILEGLQKYQTSPLTDRTFFHHAHRGAHTVQIRSADFIICASEKQKDYWLGWLSALGRTNPYLHQHDPTLSNLIDIVPFGIPRDTPLLTNQVLRRSHEGINPNDTVVIWGGGVWNWLDPYTLIRAMAKLANTHPTIKLFFMGINSPNPQSAKMQAADHAIELSRQLGIHGQSVFFNDWVLYQERHNYLLEADIGASLHPNHIETRFSFRTRLLDYIWTGLPILTSAGDTMSEEVKHWNLGRVVDCGDVEQVSQALIELSSLPNLREHFKPYFERVQHRYEWETVMTPLIRFCDSPHLAADKPFLKQTPLTEAGTSGWWALPLKVLHTTRRYGALKLAYQIKEYLKWKLLLR